MSNSKSFDDYLMSPRYSDIESRSEVSLETSLGPYTFSLPIISSPMDTITNAEMAAAMAEAGGLGIVHRGQEAAVQAHEVGLGVVIAREKGVKDPIIGAAIGVKVEDVDRAERLVDAGAKILCIDVCHGHHINVKRQIKRLQHLNTTIIAGNIATRNGAMFLADQGVAGIRVGIGNGSICSTRLNTGHGVPQATALMHAAWGVSGVMDSTSPPEARPALISDGGCRNGGDIVKALALGADMVMLGSMLSGTYETPGNCDDDGYKVYRGMASEGAQADWGGGVKSVEGVTAKVRSKGAVGPLLDALAENLRAGLSYSGARTIKDLQACADRIIVSQSSLRESDTHIRFQ